MLIFWLTGGNRFDDEYGVLVCRGRKPDRRFTNAKHSKIWWLQSPQVPKSDLSDTARKRLLYQCQCKVVLVRGVFKMDFQSLERKTLDRNSTRF
ncbi:hypothetical protein AAZX31_01G139400 [Glycine max]|uniref:Uncharacterized protein n=1 Tax=Glycine soja TaxID=3848 RepID=A0A445M3Q2_GLYSO|nr:hypothetical protein D0Y65_001618 [Glycine soja]